MKNPLADLAVIARTGLLRPQGPRAALRAVAAARKWELTFAGVTAIAAARYPEAVAIVDEDGVVTYGELHRTSNTLANELRSRGIGHGDGVGLLCRDSRFFVQAVAAVSKVGADLLLLNTSFSGPQLAEVMQREGAKGLIHDPEFGELVSGVPDDVARLDAFPAGGSDAEPDAPAGPGRQIILTSGTTGTPKGARRPPSTPTDAIVGFLASVPLKARRTHVVAAPMFHSWGFAHMGLTLMLGGRLVVQRRFDPEATLELMSRHRADVIALVPVMAQRIMALPAGVRGRYDCSALRVAALGGSAIPGDLAVEFMDAFGDVAYNTYGSTEVAIVTIASPADLRADPQTAGRPVSNVVVKLLDEAGRPVPEGQSGRIFVASSATFEGYTGGGSKDLVDGLMATGDVGRFDAGGRLRIEGRDDDMIVSGGENVFPAEVEDVIANLDGVVEAAVIGAEDEDFGQRLVAFVVADGVTEETIKATVRDRLARYKVPRDVIFMDELPRTATGKVLKRELQVPG
jgi:fatty-acyl-CoA synthase